MIALTIPVEPRPMPRPHAARNGGVYHPSWLKDYRTEVQAHIMLGMRGHEPFTEAVGVAVSFVQPEKRDHRRDGDIDNYLKLLFDCCNGLVWKDDKQVRRLYGVGLFEAERGRIELRVWGTLVEMEAWDNTWTLP